ncbi:unnamed protein product [Cylicocyclus nassatus]|uniref:Uncharacterized protein n=1 Tax=Cylicocyclus nassatus TaxID=53992 RepID=A0AA36DUU4_CYLNA|nr:unnamed protein product [Cylicocyclus nassatus]
MLNHLNVESRPTEIFRMEMLSKSRLLKNSPAYENVFIRKSMTLQERTRERELRIAARELNEKEEQLNGLSVCPLHFYFRKILPLSKKPCPRSMFLSYFSYETLNDNIYIHPTTFYFLSFRLLQCYF